MVVFKFGGKSLGTFEKVDAVCDYIKKRCKDDKLIVVVSAFAGETDRLCDLFSRYGCSGDCREKDVLLSTGETQSAALVAARLMEKKVRAISLQAFQAGIFALGGYGNAVITRIDTKILKNQLEDNDVLVVTGFQAINSLGETVTIGRNGSDVSAVALGSALCSPVEIYSDFDGVFCGDPRNLNFKKIESINYDDIDKLSESGARVVANGCGGLAKNAGIMLKLKAADKPNESGTIVCKCRTDAICVTRVDNLSKIVIDFFDKKEMLNKNAKYIVDNIKYSAFYIKNDTIEVITDSKNAAFVEKNIAEFNNLIGE